MIKIPFWISHIFPRIDLLSHKKTGFSFNFQAMVTWFDPGIGGRDQEIESSSQTKARSKTGNQANHQASWNERDTWTCNYLFLMFQISAHFFIKRFFCFFCTFWFSSTDSIKCSSFDHFFWQFLGPWRWKFRKKKEKKFKQDPPPVPKPTTQEVTPTTEKEDVPPPVVEEDWQLIKNSI